jgi:predicted Mrr-cat superfamily restriction endonuclease
MKKIRYWRIILEPEWCVWETCRDKGIIALGYADSPGDLNVKKFKGEMQVSHKVIAYLKNWRIGALGTIIGKYSIDEAALHGQMWRIRRVKWNYKSLRGWDFAEGLSDETKAALAQRAAVWELTEKQYKEIEKQILLL